jgi:hypothetical protein
LPARPEFSAPNPRPKFGTFHEIGIRLACYVAGLAD